jgi:glycyl-tRNA synthetase
VLSLPSLVAPTKVLLVPLSKSPEFTLKVRKLSARLRSLGISHNIDDTSASIGKRYSRNDELGTPFGVTVDFESLRDGMITLRDRDSMKQVRASSDEILSAIVNLVNSTELWSNVSTRLLEFVGPTEEE